MVLQVKNYHIAILIDIHECIGWHSVYQHFNGDLNINDVM
jgi:hypothetical protein